MITAEILNSAREYAKASTTTYPALRRFIEINMENADRAAAARRGNVALDSVPHISHFMDPEAAAAADAIWDALESPALENPAEPPLKFFEGKTYREGLEAYEASTKRPRSKATTAVICDATEAPAAVHPLKFFEGKPYQQGLEDYRASLKTQAPAPTKRSKGAYI